MAYRFVPITERDRAWLDELRRAAYHDLFVATWGGWDEERHTRHFRSCWERGAISAIEFDGVRVGMIQRSEQNDAVEIHEIQIHPSYQGQGIGTRLLQDIIARAHAEGKKVCLSTGRYNLRAVKLYRRLGLVATAQTKTHHHMVSDPSGN